MSTSNENDEQVSQDFKLLNAVNDRYGGVIVEVNEPIDSALFASVLRASIAQWRYQVFFLPSYSLNLIHIHSHTIKFEASATAIIALTS